MQYTFKNNKITFKYMENKETRTDIKKHYKNIEKEEKIECRAKVIFDTSEKMDKVKDETVQLIVTSPPYWDLKNYYKQNQIGKEDYGTYSKRIETVWRECYKKLKKDGSSSFDDILELVKNEFEKKLTEGEIRKTMSNNVKIGKNKFVSIIPLSLKKILVKLSYIEIRKYKSIF